MDARHKERQTSLLWNASELREYQWDRLSKALAQARRDNAFYRDKFAPFGSITRWEDWDRLPTTQKSELFSEEDAMGLSRNHTWPHDHYQRFHRTSGTTGKPLVIQDTQEDWEWWIDTWQHVLDVAELTSIDRVFMAFSFGPFIGFWSAHDACLRRGAMVIPGGGMSTAARLHLIHSSQATIVCCTPSYALHMAESAKALGIDLRTSNVRCLIVAGEPGGSRAEIRSRIETAWDARVVDHAGGTEIGPWGVGSVEGDGLFVIETEFLAEFLPVQQSHDLQVSPTREIDTVPCELVLTPLARKGCPLFRYRTGDLVHPLRDNRSAWVRLQGGILGRVDDMLIVRGVNIFPSSIEAILLSFPDVHEFRMIAFKEGALDQLRIEVETDPSMTSIIADRIQIQIGLRVDVQARPPNTFPRSEGKSRRFIDQR